MRSVLAADLGGTKCRFALVTEDLRVLSVRKVETTMERPTFLARMEQGLREVAGKSRPSIVREYADAVIAGLLNAYGEK